MKQVKKGRNKMLAKMKKKQTYQWLSLPRIALFKFVVLKEKQLALLFT